MTTIPFPRSKRKKRRPHPLITDVALAPTRSLAERVLQFHVDQVRLLEDEVTQVDDPTLVIINACDIEQVARCQVQKARQLDWISEDAAVIWLAAINNPNLPTPPEIDRALVVGLLTRLGDTTTGAFLSEPAPDARHGGSEAA